LAYCLAVEQACGIKVPPRASVLRNLLLELERMYNHVADVGAMCNDVGFGLVQAKALTLRERLLRLNESITGHRLLRGGVRVGGTRLASLPRPSELVEIGTQFHELVSLALDQSIVMDRFRGTAVLNPDDIAELGVLGVVARASGSVFDARVAHSVGEPPPNFLPASASTGDVLARFQVRVQEVDASLVLLDDFCGRPGPPHAFGPDHVVAGVGSGSGIVEGWRGAIVHRIEVDGSGRLSRVKVVDPSFFNWPALSVALADTIVPDFPLANKSFNLSYAGNDL
jgi:Ni,Fe-hydrogenase III large subunit